MRVFQLVFVLYLGVGLPCTALAQPTPSTTATVAVSDPATLKAAREVVTQMQGDRTALLSAIAAPMVGMMQQIGIKQQDQAQALVQEVVMPTLTEHYDELLDIQARSFASALGKDDLQAIAAFYATPAGKRLVTAQPQLAQAQLAGTQQWMQSVMPEMQGKLTKAIQAHGWTAGGQAKPR
ncbi:MULTISPECIES: DUF2059 domain-containing protein [unclassified Methylobacterium]|uniref:DUF2059 domain-containing protein n=1 Tax=unclassified Methylobacterium TaxID=2615210 RepID=UPI0006F3964C|nr:MULTISPECIES: DUF2059 domain-containing protein [unclassified Methylobacterium]KQP79425.1 hypothetical protein ASF60_22680 [Methylobacterium sp. Leaf113]MCK2057144.1 DUF2059 domain-containing protein [Methylobacterium sp. 37f]